MWSSKYRQASNEKDAVINFHEEGFSHKNLTIYGIY